MNSKRLNNLTKPTFLLILVIITPALFLNVYNINFPTGYHIDETKKFRFVNSMNPDFRHPILMIQMARLLTSPVDPSKHHQPFVVLCRLVSALSGVLIVVIFFQVLRKRLGEWPALLASLGLAFSPIMVVHSHYLKEDMVFTFFSILTLFALVRFYRDQSLLYTAQLGIVSGLALSAQYKGFLLFILILASPLFAGKTDRRAFYTNIPIVLTISTLVFFAVNYVVFIHPENFLQGLLYETRHIMKGHTLRIDPFSYFFSFHLVNSIAPGINWFFTILGIIGLTWILLKWRETGSFERLFTAYFLIFYFTQESVPLKPFPGFPRYMIPVIPAMFFFIAFLFNSIIHKVRLPTISVILTCIISASILFSLYDSFLLDYHLNKDTRGKAESFIIQSGEKAIFERYATREKSDARWLTDIDIEKAKRQGVKLLVASSLNYGRFYLEDDMKGQSPNFYRLRKKYNHLFTFPFKEIRPAHRTYAYSNPVIRIIDISKNKQPN